MIKILSPCPPNGIRALLHTQPFLVCVHPSIFDDDDDDELPAKFPVLWPEPNVGL